MEGWLLATKVSHYTNGLDVVFGYQGNTCLGPISVCVHGWTMAFCVHPTDDRFGIIMDSELYGHQRVKISVNNFVWKARLISAYRSWDGSFRLPFQQGWIYIVLTKQP